MVVIPAFSIVLYPTSTTSNSDVDDSIGYDLDKLNDTVKTDRSVIVFGNDAEYDQISSDLESCTSNVNLISTSIFNANLSDDDTSSYDSSDEVSMYLFTDSWFENNTSKVATSTIRNLINSGDIVTVTKNNNISWSALKTTVVSSKDSDLTSIYKEDNKTYCFGAITDCYSEAVQKTYSWAEEVTEEDKVIAGTGSNLGQEVEAFYSVSCAGYGYMYLRTVYYEILDTNPTYNYYIARYTTILAPNSGNYNSGLDIYAKEVKGVTMAYGPYAVSGQSLASVNLGYTMGTNGLTLTGGLAWNYAIQNVNVMNYSNIGSGIVDIRHDISESSGVGTSVYTAEPGKISKFDVRLDDEYQSNDSFQAQFCKHWLFGYKDFRNFKVYSSVFIDVT